MKLPRRKFLHLAAGAAALPAVSRITWAQAYPTRPVRIIAGYPPGGAMSQRLGQPFVVENRPGAGGNVGSDAAAHAAPDGYTLLMSGIGNTISATLYDKLNYDFIRDFAPVAGVMRAANVVDVHPSVPVNSVPELIAYAKANPGKVATGSPGVGTSPHLSGELFKLMTGVDMLHVPYRGNAPALTDLLAGQLQVLFDSISSSIEHIRSGKVRALAVTTATRVPSLPDVPTVGEFVPGYEVSVWFSVCAPRNTPPDPSILPTLHLSRVRTRESKRCAGTSRRHLPPRRSKRGKRVSGRSPRTACHSSAPCRVLRAPTWRPATVSGACSTRPRPARR
jgi:tripartite-type tricarboxylate transporter receptor subunit TctC